MPYTRTITAPSVILVSRPQLLEEGIRQFFEEQGVADYPALYEDTPVERLLDMINDDETDHGELLIEFAGRQCYKAWKQGRVTSEYLQNIVETKHGSVLAHAHYSFQISGISRSLSLELNRHSAGVDISQESQRFVDAKTACFVAPPALLDMWGGDLECESAAAWFQSNLDAIAAYERVQEEVSTHLMNQAAVDAGAATAVPVKTKTLIKKRANETARCHLPNDVETKGVWTFNIRALRHIINLRGAADADLEIRRLAAELALQMKIICPYTFFDVEIGEGDFGVPVVTTQIEKP